ncbi:Bug family tripartite tricarboxylate transporter substrate binding protein [Pseudoroseomonas globiformis]|uniref:Bug family tripartite tricarboxylate transporter substrate binding protein n=1 Tax=Teichococcus globiformis TaxID=2307229 RepID=A0ABV7G3P2_9PROT
MTYTLRRRSLLAAPALLLPASGGSRAQGAAWPTRPLQMIVGFPAGGTTDIFARLVAEALGRRLQQPVVVDNRSGAGGSIGAAMVAQAPADGYTLHMATIGTASINYSLYNKLGYAPEDLASVSRVCEVANVIMVPADSPFKSLGELVEAARKKPRDLTFAHSGVGTSLHLTGELLAVEAGVQFTHVPYRGTSQWLPELLAGRVDFGIDNLPSSLSQLQEGKLRALALTGEARHPGIPEVPTTAEAGYPTVQAMAWWGVQVSRKTPRPIIDRLAAELQAIAEDADFRRRTAEQGATPVRETPEQFEAFVASEIAKWRGVIQKANIQVE